MERGIERGRKGERERKGRRERGRVIEREREGEKEGRAYSTLAIIIQIAEGELATQAQ